MAIPAPEEIPEFRHNYVRWLRANAAPIWRAQHDSGTRFIFPPELLNSPSTWINPFPTLVEYYAETAERAKLYTLSKEMTLLAYRTQMDKFLLTVDVLPSLVGLMVWQAPVGEAESFTAYSVPINKETGEVDTEGITAQLHHFGEAPSPIIAALWRYDPENEQVWVAFLSDHLKFMIDLIGEDGVRDHPEFVAPVGFEREQALPVNKTLAWFDADPAEDRIPITAFADPKDFPTEDLKQKANERTEAIRPQLTQMVKTLIASWMLMKWKIAQREDLPAPRAARKRMARESGTDIKSVEEAARVRVIRLGAPLQHRAPREGTKGGKWKVRAIVGPYIRERQYIPAWDTYDETPRLIEPYIAGPEGAPISNADKVFLLE